MNWRQSTSAMRDEVPTSRALNVTASAADVRALCTQHKLAISAIETLLSGGTRVVMMNGDDAANLKRLMKSKVIVGDVKRTAWVQNY